MKISSANSIILVVDIQEKLLPHIHEYELLLQRMQILISGLKFFNIPFYIYEQYSKLFGTTHKNISELLANEPKCDRNIFSCCKHELSQQKVFTGKKNLAIVFGIETHICIMQTCLDLLASNITPILVTDCCGSRKMHDHDMAIMRMAQAGVVPTSYEALLFELCGSSESEHFKSIYKLVNNTSQI